MSEVPTYYEFFAGGGMARCGLGSKWKCTFANDFDHKKCAIYRKNWGSQELRAADIRALCIEDLPSSADLAWGSFPCQDLSLAGGGAGLKGERSGTFYPFWDLVRGLAANGRAPRIIALENVCGAITSHGGKDFASICATFDEAGYRFGALVVDAELFVPHSRPRLFFVGVHRSISIASKLVHDEPQTPWHTRALQTARERLPYKIARNWLWWRLPLPPRRSANLSHVVEDNPFGRWHTTEETGALLAMMSPVNRAKVEIVSRLQSRIVGCIYKRTRKDGHGNRVQRAEVRFDNVAGCLRTPAGGSSRQVLIVVERGEVKSRLITIRETARLMGLPDSYKLPLNYNEGYHLTGDGVAVPVVRHLAEHLFEPILADTSRLLQLVA